MTELLAIFGVFGLVVFVALGAYMFGARVVRYRRGKGAPYRDQEEKEAVRKAPLSEILSEAPRSGRKLLVLVALACCCAYLIADGGRTIGAVTDYLGSLREPSVADGVEGIYNRYRLGRNLDVDEDGNTVEALSPSERSLNASQLMVWIDEYGDDDDNSARNSLNSRQRFALRVLSERSSFEDTEALSAFVLQGSGAVFGRDCDASSMELANLAMLALRERWPVSERAFRAVYFAATSLECSSWPGSSTWHEDDYRDAAWQTLQDWRAEHPEDFERIMTRLNLGYQLQR